MSDSKNWKYRWTRNSAGKLRIRFKSHKGALPENAETLQGSPRLQVEQAKPGLNLKLSVALISVAIAATFSACTYKTPGVEELAPVDSDIPKSFFLKTQVDPISRKSVTVPKKFLCGWASEMEVGDMASWFYTNNAIATEHCNLVFEINEGMIVGKLVNPSFPNDSSRWESVLTIPVASHHYVEREKDSAGRETNKVVRNSSRSHWSARPNMLLDLEGLNLNGTFKPYENHWIGNAKLKISNVEWDFKNGFLGLTMEKETGRGSYARVRFNIKEFETNPDFKSTPFNDKNYKYMNVLHIIGEKVKGVYPILRAAHWDISKKIEIRLWQVPDKYKDLVKEVVSDWNEVFRNAEATTMTDGPFVVSDTPAVHAFDLRYPTIAWVADDKISSYSPLGIGMALADVTNGEIKWGMITLYGGYIETYMKSYLETSGGNAVSKTVGRLARSLSDFIKKPKMTNEMDFVNNIQSAIVSDKLIERINPTATLQVNGIQNPTANSSANSKKEAPKVDINLPSYLQSKNLLEKILAKNKMTALEIRSSTQQMMSGRNVTEMINSDFLNKKSTSEEDSEMTPAQKPPTDRLEMSAALQKKYSGSTFCLDRSIADVAPGWAAALGKTEDAVGSLANDEKTLRNLVKELITHEFGHFLGLGHQFKESILPAKDAVPENLYQALASKANEENKFTNYSSVMGYRSPRTELAEKTELKPGPHDLLVIRYLYKQQYSTFKKGDGQFTFAPIPADGIVPPVNPENKEYKTSYFPQCNDIDASYGFDPFCNRFDTGYNATTIVQKYFEDIRVTLPQTLVAFTDNRGDAWEAEGRLWMRALSNLGRVRTFYDYMRVYYKAQFDEIRSNEEALMNFSTACREQKVENIKIKALNKIFTDKPELMDLCRANGLALQKMKEIVQSKGRDYTNVDITNHTSPGGLSGGDAERDYSHITGTWKELSIFPLKYASLLAITEPSPWVMLGPWMIPNFLYTTPQTLFSYMYIYPREYTDVMATNIKSNVQFAGVNGAEKTALGRSILSMLWMNWSANNDNRDAGLFPKQYIEKIRAQQKFDVSLVAVIMKGVPREGGPTDRIVRWTGDVYDFVADKAIPLNSAYLLPKGNVIANAADMILFPVSEFTPYTATDGYSFAFKLQLNQTNQPDGLSDLSAKKDLNGHADKLLYACMNGQNNGLKNFFTSENPEFEGFLMGPNLERSEENKKKFLDSIDEAFATYYSNKKPSNPDKALFDNPPKPDTCMEAIRGLGLLINTGAIMNGYVLPQVFDYIQ